MAMSSTRRGDMLVARTSRYAERTTRRGGTDNDLLLPETMCRSSEAVNVACRMRSSAGYKGRPAGPEDNDEDIVGEDDESSEMMKNSNC